jgi:hypothetical protein
MAGKHLRGFSRAGAGLARSRRAGQKKKAAALGSGLGFVELFDRLKSIYQNLSESKLSLAIREPVRVAHRVETIVRTPERSRSLYL